MPAAITAEAGLVDLQTLDHKCPLHHHVAPKRRHHAQHAISNIPLAINPGLRIKYVPMWFVVQCKVSPLLGSFVAAQVEGSPYVKKAR
jgi:hypothetical protein